MTKEKLFELAVQLASANISAGQFVEPRNFCPMAIELVDAIYDQLEDLWERVSIDVEEEGGAPSDPEGNLPH